MRGRGLDAGRRRRKLTNNEVKAFLNRARWIERQIRADEERIAELRRSFGSTGIDYTKEPGHGGAPHDFGDTVALIVDYEATLEARKHERIDALRNIEAVIARVDADDNRLALLLSLRYLDGKKWEDVAVEMGYTFRQTMRLHRAALATVKAKMS